MELTGEIHVTPGGLRVQDNVASRDILGVSGRDL